MNLFEDYKQSLLDYLYKEQQLTRRDIELVNQMSREEKIEADMLIPDVSVEKSDCLIYVLNTPQNYSKLRSGDKVILKRDDEESKIKALVVDTDTNSITVCSEKEICLDKTYDLEMDSPDLLGSLIGCLKGILPATPGASFLRMLSGEDEFYSDDIFSLIPEQINGLEKLYTSLNRQQQEAVKSMLKFYPIHILQGPPGTGKTQVLAVTAIASSLKNREVVIIANTHQAVNNALLKVHQLDNNVPLFKIGELLKAEELDDDIHKFQKFAEYNEFSRENRRKKKYGYVLGMTIWGAISNLGLRTHSHFRPYIALVDEASLMPLTYASVLGKCAPSICFFGDSRQMPPIFRPEMKESDLSESILDYCSEKVVGTPVCVLPETHRMNNDITEIVSRSFYEPHGIKLSSARDVAGKRFKSTLFTNLGLVDSISFIAPAVSTPMCKEENEGEAIAIIEMLYALLEEGNRANDIAVITPFRKQVRLLRTKAKDKLRQEQIPLIDTVERLQGQDVNCIILSFVTSDEDYMKQMNDFLFDYNRLNVMISRAKTKVVIVGSEMVQRKLKNILLK